MYHLAPIAPEELSDEQKQLANRWEEQLPTLLGNEFVIRRADGAYLGPFAPLLYTPELSRAWGDVALQLKKITALPPSARETAILATGAKWKAAYEIYSHERLALATTSLTERQINQIKTGVKPADLSDGDSVAFDVATELLTQMMPLSGASWERAVRAFGRDGAIALVHYVGYYSHTCLILNGFSVPLPEGERIK